MNIPVYMINTTMPVSDYCSLFMQIFSFFTAQTAAIFTSEKYQNQNTLLISEGKLLLFQMLPARIKNEA